MNSEYCPICLDPRVRYWGSAKDIGDDAIQHAVLGCRSCHHLFICGYLATDLEEAYARQEKSFFPDPSYYEKRRQSPPTDGEIWVHDHLDKWHGEPGSVLDIGPGRPSYLRNLQSQGWDAFAVEPGKHAELIAQEAGCRVYHALFESVEFPKKFDVIIALDVLEHTGDPIRFLERIRHNLADDGVAFFRFPNSASLRRWIQGQNWEMIRPLGHLHYFSPISFDLACRRVGLQVNRWTSRDVFKYRGLRLPGLLGHSVMGARRVLDGLGIGDQILASVSRGSLGEIQGSKWSAYARLRPWRARSRVVP